MNTTLTQSHPITFDVEPIFKVYEQVAGFYDYPTPEYVVNYYDLLVQDKLNDIYFGMNPGSLKKNHPWDLHAVEDDVIGMRAYLATEELISVLDRFHMMYIDNYNVPRNIPYKEVW